MQLENLKRWHWIVIGLLLGLLIAGARSVTGPDLGRDKDKILQGEFARDILEPPLSTTQEIAATRPTGQALRHSYFESIVVHPPVSGDLTRTYYVDGTLREWVQSQSRKSGLYEQKFFYQAKTPYIPKPNYLVKNAPWLKADPKFDVAKATALYTELETAEQKLDALHAKRVGLLNGPSSKPATGDAPAGLTAESPEIKAIDSEETAIRQTIANGPTVKDYLDQLKVKYPTVKIPYRFAWNEIPLYNFIIWTVGMTVAVGGIWPSIVRLLLGAGFGREPVEETDDRYKLSKAPSKTPEKKVVSNELTQSDMDRLKALEEELAPAIADAMNRPAPTAAAPAKPAIPVLAEKAPVEPPKVEEKSKAVKTFGATGGDFYPTEVHSDPKKK